MKKLIQIDKTNSRIKKNKTFVFDYSKTLVLVAMTVFSLILVHPQWASAYIPDLQFILRKSTDTTGKKIIQIEQEVIFKVGEEEARVDETWLIEGDRNLKLTAIGKGLYKQNINLHFLYNGKNKTYIVGKNKMARRVDTDFFQRYLFIRSKNSFSMYLKEMGIPENLRLSRASGAVAFLIGQPSVQTLNPQVWIGQDDFVIRKIRLPSAAEIELDNVAAFPNDTMIARSQNIRWPSNSYNSDTGALVRVRIKKVNVNAPGSLQSFYPQNLSMPSEISFSNNTPLTETIEEFYSRFR